VAQRQDEFADRNALLIWVLQEGPTFELGTTDECLQALGALGATDGWCVGDDETEPRRDVFTTSPLSAGQGFDLIVDRRTMVIEESFSHGAAAGSDNPSVDDVLAAIDGVLAGP